MSFFFTVDRAKAFLSQHGRLSFAGLQREFGLDDAAAEQVVQELVDIQQPAADISRYVIWTLGTLRVRA